MAATPKSFVLMLIRPLPRENPSIAWQEETVTEEEPGLVKCA